MHICISGTLGSGKSSVCRILRKKHGFDVHNAGSIQRETAARHGIGTLELNSLMMKDRQYDRMIDEATADLAQNHTGAPIVFDSRMAWHFVSDAFKVYMVSNPVVAAERVAGANRGKVETYDSVTDALLKLKRRAFMENERFRLVYGVDTFDYRNYDLILDTTHISPERASQMIYDEYLKYFTCSAPGPELLFSPCSLFPLDPAERLNWEEVERCARIRSYQTESATIIPLEGYHYVHDGLRYVLAAAMNQEEFFRAELLDSETEPSAASELKSRISGLNIFSLHEFERIGGFRYASYPESYHNY